MFICNVFEFFIKKNSKKPSALKSFLYICKRNYYYKYDETISDFSLPVFFFSLL